MCSAWLGGDSGCSVVAAKSRAADAASSSSSPRWIVPTSFSGVGVVVGPCARGEPTLMRAPLWHVSLRERRRRCRLRARRCGVRLSRRRRASSAASADGADRLPATAATTADGQRAERAPRAAPPASAGARPLSGEVGRRLCLDRRSSPQPSARVLRGRSALPFLSIETWKLSTRDPRLPPYSVYWISNVFFCGGLGARCSENLVC